jgi:hypothetical protein
MIEGRAVTLQQAAELIESDHFRIQTIHRRLYDIANSLCCIGVIKKIRIERFQAFQIKGLECIQESINKLCSRK